VKRQFQMKKSKVKVTGRQPPLQQSVSQSLSQIIKITGWFIRGKLDGQPHIISTLSVDMRRVRFGMSEPPVCDDVASCQITLALIIIIIFIIIIIIISLFTIFCAC